MTRGYSSAQQTAIADEVVRPVYLAEMDFPSGFARVCNASFNLEYDSDGDGDDEVFYGRGDVGAITEIEESIEGQVRSVTMTLSGVKPALVAAALRERYQGRAATIWKVYLDENLAMIGDPKVVFAGLMDVMPFELDENGTATVGMKCVSKHVNWERPNDQPRWDDRDHRKRFPGDRYFEFMPEIANGVDVEWSNT